MVIWSDPAKADLKSIHDFIAHDSKHYAKKVAQDIRQKTEVLDELPKIGKPVAEVSDKSIRELSMYSYRIFIRSGMTMPLCSLWCIKGEILRDEISELFEALICQSDTIVHCSIGGNSPTLSPSSLYISSSSNLLFFMNSRA